VSGPVLRAETIFKRRFGCAPEELFQAPGRVNLIGEHTDYNGGFVLPTAIDLGTVVAARRRTDHIVRVIAADFDEELTEFEIGRDIPFSESARWSNYVRGVFQVLSLMSHPLLGVDMVVAGNLPRGVGLSSSASLEVVTCLALAKLYDLPLSALEIAQIAQRAENDYVDCKCGIMDQLISASGKEGHALLIDCRNLSTTPVPLPREFTVAIIDSGVRRELAESAYNQRRRECEEASRLLGVSQLRDGDMAQLEQASGAWDDVLYRRARHVITENERTLMAAEALGRGDLRAMGELMAGSHNSLRDDFEVTVPPIDTLVELVSSIIQGEGGVRMTGGGFGGCVVALVPADGVAAIRSALSTHYSAKTGHEARVFECRPSAGSGIVPDWNS